MGGRGESPPLEKKEMIAVTNEHVPRMALRIKQNNTIFTHSPAQGSAKVNITFLRWNDSINQPPGPPYDIRGDQQS
jgi:hypothetical protein